MNTYARPPSTPPTTLLCARLSALLCALLLVACEDAGPDTTAEGPDTSETDAAPEDGGPQTCSSSLACIDSVCDTALGICVPCIVSADCLASSQVCIKNQCLPELACASDKVCVAQGAVCDKDAGVCVECLVDADCDGEKVCRAKQCLPKPVPCQSSKQCASLGKVCDPKAGECADCVVDDDCHESRYCSQGLCMPDVCTEGQTSCASPKQLAVCADNGGGFVPQDCPTGKACSSGKCKPIFCQAGKKLCLGDTVATCDDRGVSTRNPTPCKSGEICVDGACLAKSCEPGDSKCGEGEVLTCGVDGQGYKAVACAKAEGGKPAEVCVVGSDGKAGCEPLICDAGKPFCVGNAVHLCDDTGTLSSIKGNCDPKGDPAQVCKGGGCVAKKCTPGSVICSDTKTQAVCDAAGAGFTDKACDSGKVCESGKCVPPICKPGETFCSGDTVQKCSASGGGTTSIESCGAANKTCVDGVCKSQVCKPSGVACSKDAKAIETCAADGLSFKSAPCGAGTVCSAAKCVPKTCEPSKLYCQGNSVAQCNSLGTVGTVLSACGSGKTCIDGACVSSICGPGATLCDGLDAMMVCKSDGTGWVKSPCQGGSVCVGGSCKATKCTPKGLFCDGNAVHQCSADGTSSSALKTCAATKFCVSGACVDAVCTPGKTECDKGQIKSCKADGSGWTSTSCGTGKTCDKGACIDKICTETVAASAQTSPQIDLIVGVDTSGSMGQEAKSTSSQLNAMMAQLDTAGLDWRVVLLAKDTGCCKLVIKPPYVNNPNKFLHVKSPIYSTDGLKRIIDYYPQYKGFLRPGAFVHFLMVTDDESMQMTSTVFEQKLGALQSPGFPNGYTFHSIVAYGPLAKKGCSTGARIGQQYLNLTNKTGGFKQPVCANNYSQLFGQMSNLMTQQGATKSKCAYPLPQSAQGYPQALLQLVVKLISGGQTQTFPKASSASACGTGQSYYLEPPQQPTHVVLCEYGCVSAGGQPLTLAYPCQ